MGTLRTNYSAPLGIRVYGGDQNREQVTLFDVGCSGGIETFWKTAYGPFLRSVGFDPLVAEIARLNSIRQDHESFENVFVGCETPEEKGAEDSKSNDWFSRTSAIAFYKIRKLDFVKEHLNAGQEVTFSDKNINLDSYVKSKRIPKVDILKTDTDGHDIKVLHGAGEVLKGCIGATVECSFHGSLGKYENTFANVDALMRSSGFTLLDLDSWRYTRAALPGRFQIPIPAQTHDGAIQWCDTVYGRDLADPEYEKKYDFKPTGEDILKLAVFYDLMGLKDNAAELLVARRDMVASLIDVDGALDSLVPDHYGRGLTYKEYINAFERHPERLLPDLGVTTPKQRSFLARLLPLTMKS